MIRTQKYERVTRVYLQSGSRFWLDGGLSGFGRTDHEMEVWHATAGQPGSRGILMLYLRGELAESVGSMTGRGRVRWGLGAGADVFPDLPDHFQGGLSWSWADDPWARGAHAYAGPGDMMSLHRHLAEPEGRVHFVGEHTTIWPGWMEGALHSGLRAASEVAEA